MGLKYRIGQKGRLGFYKIVQKNQNELFGQPNMTWRKTKPGGDQEVTCSASVEGQAGWSEGPVPGGHAERLKDVRQNGQTWMIGNGFHLIQCLIQATSWMVRGDDQSR